MSSQPHNIESAPSSPFLEMLSGAEKGKVYDLLASHITLGRSDDNDIVIVSDAVSRHHAILEQTPEGWSVRDNGSKNGISINGVRIEQALLHPGDVVQVGDFAFRFGEAGGGPLENNPVFEGPVLEGMGVVPESLPEPGVGFSTPPIKVPSRGGNRRLLVYGTVGLLIGALWFTNNSGNQDAASDNGQARTQGAATPADGTKSSDKLARDFDLTPKPDLSHVSVPEKPVGREDPILTKAEEQMSKVDLGNTPAQRAEQFFRRGQREYMNKNYERAIDDFRTCLTFNRGHELAAKYLSLVTHEAESEAKLHMQNGVRYFESLQYQRAIYDFQQVVELMSHRPSERIITEAEKYIAICKQRLQQAELFP